MEFFTFIILPKNYSQPIMNNIKKNIIYSILKYIGIFILKLKKKILFSSDQLKDILKEGENVDNFHFLNLVSKKLFKKSST